jgi:hypothetical protein
VCRWNGCLVIKGGKSASEPPRGIGTVLSLSKGEGLAIVVLTNSLKPRDEPHVATLCLHVPHQLANASVMKNEHIININKMRTWRNR